MLVGLNDAKVASLEECGVCVGERERERVGQPH